MDELLIGYARVSTNEQDLTAQQNALERLGVRSNLIYTDHGLTGTNRARPGSREAGLDPVEWTPHEKECSLWQDHIATSPLNTKTRP